MFARHELWLLWIFALVREGFPPDPLTQPAITIYLTYENIHIVHTLYDARPGEARSGGRLRYPHTGNRLTPSCWLDEVTRTSA